MANGLKVYGYLALAIALIAALAYVDHAIYETGYKAATAEQQAAYIKAEAAALAKAKADWQKAADASKAEVQAQEKIVEVERIVERKIPQAVTKIVTVHPECADLGNDFLGLYNDAIGAPAAAGSTAAVAQPAG